MRKSRNIDYKEIILQHRLGKKTNQEKICIEIYHYHLSSELFYRKPDSFNNRFTIKKKKQILKSRFGFSSQITNLLKRVGVQFNCPLWSAVHAGLSIIFSDSLSLSLTLSHAKLVSLPLLQMQRWHKPASISAS